MNPVVRFGAGSLASLAEVCGELGIARPLLVTTQRGAASVGSLPVVGTFSGVRPHVPVETVAAGVAAYREVEADGLVGLGGGAAVDTCKAVVAALANEPEAAASEAVESGIAGSGATETEKLPRIVAVPTTYAGAEWTPYFGMLLEPGRKSGGFHPSAVPAGAIYDPELTLELPLRETVGTSMNALAHCAEAYYHPDSTDRAARHADTGSTAIAYALPLVVARPHDLYARTRLLEGAMRAARALAASGLCLGHAMAQGVGGRYGIAQGEANAVCLPAALRFNVVAVPDAVRRFGRSLGADDAAEACVALAALGGFDRLRSLGVPEDDLGGLAEVVAARPGARANPRPADANTIEELLREVW